MISFDFRINSKRQASYYYFYFTIEKRDLRAQGHRTNPKWAKKLSPQQQYNVSEKKQDVKTSKESTATLKLL